MGWLAHIASEQWPVMAFIAFLQVVVTGVAVYYAVKIGRRQNEISKELGSRQNEITQEVGRRQNELAQTQIKLDLYNRRYAAYEKAINFLQAVLKDGFVNGPQLNEFSLCVRECEFIFEDDLLKYLQDMEGKGRKMLFLSPIVYDPVINQQTRDADRPGFLKTVNEFNDLQKWCLDELQRGHYAERFKKYLDFSKL